MIAFCIEEGYPCCCKYSVNYGMTVRSILGADTSCRKRNDDEMVVDDSHRRAVENSDVSFFKSHQIHRTGFSNSHGCTDVQQYQYMY